MKKTMLMIAVTVISFYHMNAQEKLSLSLQQSLELGLKSSKTLHSSRAKVSAAENKTKEAAAGGLPLVTLSGGYTRLSDVPSFAENFSIPGFPALEGFGDAFPVILDNYVLRLGVQQPLFTGNAISESKEMASHLEKAAQADLQKDAAETGFNIKSAYWNYYKSLKVLGVTEKNVQQLEAYKVQVGNLSGQGLATRNDELKISVQISEANIRMLDAENMVELARVNLCNILGLPLNTQIELTDKASDENYTSQNASSLYEEAYNGRGEIAAAKHRAEASKSGIEIAESKYYPQISLVGGVNYNNPNQRIMPLKEQFDATWDVGVQFTFNLWNWGQTKYQAAQAEAQLVQAQDAVASLKDMVAVEVTQNTLTLNQAKKKIAVAEAGKEQAEENLRVNNERLGQGLALTTDIIDAEFASLQANISYETALADYQVAKARLEKSLGKNQ